MDNKIIQIAATSGEFAKSSRIYALDAQGNIYLCRGTDDEITWLQVPCPINNAESPQDLELIPLNGGCRARYKKYKDFEASCEPTPPLVETITKSTKKDV